MMNELTMSVTAIRRSLSYMYFFMLIFIPNTDLACKMQQNPVKLQNITVNKILYCIESELILIIWQPLVISKKEHRIILINSLSITYLIISQNVLQRIMYAPTFNIPLRLALIDLSTIVIMLARDFTLETTESHERQFLLKNK